MKRPFAVSFVPFVVQIFSVLLHAVELSLAPKH